MVNLAAVGLFSVLLPLTGVVLPMIASDLLVGVGYIAATLGVLSTHGLNPTGALASAGAQCLPPHRATRHVPNP